MWSSIHLAVHPMWDTCQYVVTATWRDQAGGEPVTLTQDGEVWAHTLDGPADMLAVVLEDLTARGLERRQHAEG